MPQGDLRWARPGERTFAMAIREKYPDEWADTSDSTLEGIFTHKYPGQYDDIPRTVPPGQTAEGLEQYQRDRARGFRPRRTIGGTLKDLLITAGSQTLGAFPGTAVGLADLATGIAGRGTPVGDWVGSTRGGSIEERQRLLESFLSPAQQYASQRVGEAEGVRGTLEAVRRNPSVIPQTVVGALPHMLAGAGIGRGALWGVGKVAPKLVGALRPVAPAVGEGMVSGAQTAGQVREQMGGLTPGQAGLAAGSGFLTGALTRIGGRIAREIGVADIDSVLAGVQTDSGLRRNVVQRILAGMVQEGVLEELPQSIQEQIAQNQATGQPLGTGVSQAGVLGFFAGAIVGGGTQMGPTPTPPPLVRLEMEAMRASAENEAVNTRRASLQARNAPSADINQAIEDGFASYEKAQAAIAAYNEERQRLGLSGVQDQPIPEVIQEALADDTAAPPPDVTTETIPRPTTTDADVVDVWDHKGNHRQVTVIERSAQGSILADIDGKEVLVQGSTDQPWGLQNPNDPSFNPGRASSVTTDDQYTPLKDRTDDQLRELYGREQTRNREVVAQRVAGSAIWETAQNIFAIKKELQRRGLSIPTPEGVSAPPVTPVEAGVPVGEPVTLAAPPDAPTVPVPPIVAEPETAPTPVVEPTPTVVTPAEAEVGVPPVTPSDQEARGPEVVSPQMPDDRQDPTTLRRPGPGAGLGVVASTREVRVSSIIADLNKGLGDIPLVVEELRRLPRTEEGGRAAGVYRSPERSIAMQRANDLDTYLHEAGHDMDISLLQIPRRKQIWTGELLKLGAPTSRPRYTQTARLREGAAEFFRLYLADPGTAQTEAPLYFKEFERKLAKYPQAAKVLKQAQAGIAQVQGFTPTERITRRVRYTEDEPSTLARLFDQARTPEQNLIYDDQVTNLEEALITAKTSTERTAIEEQIKTIQNRRLARPLSTAVQEVAIDDLVGLKQAVMTMAAGHPLATTENAYVMARLARGAGGMASSFVESDQGVTLADGTPLGPSLKQALEPVLDTFEKGDQQIFEAYLISLRVLELHDRGLPQAITQSEAKDIIQEVKQRPDFAAFEKARDAIYAHQDAVLEYAIDGGLLTQEQADTIRKVNRFYVPFNRAQDDRAPAGILNRATELSGARRGIAGQRAPIQRIGKSGKDLLPPLQQIIANDFAWVSAVEQNRAMLALTDQAAGRRRGQKGVAMPDSARWMERIPAPIAATRFAGEQLRSTLTGRLDEIGIELPPAELDSLLDIYVTVFTPTKAAREGDDTVSVMKQGKREYWEVKNQSLLNAISAVGPKDMARWLQWAQSPARLLRAGATLAPGFIIRNPARDTLVAWLQSRHGFLPVVDTVLGLYEQFRPESVARDLFYRHGIAQATLAGNDRNQRELAIKNMGKSGLQRVVQNPIDLLRALSSQMEVASRLGEFKLALESGGQERGVLSRLFGPKLDPNQWDENVIATAALAARDVTTDFQRAGSWSREINRWDAFFNAQVQGVTRMGETALRDPAGMSMKLGLMGLMSTALWFGNADDEEYQELPEWEKHIYWHVKLPGNTTWFRIPKPFDYGYVADFTEAGLDLIAKEDPRRLRQIKDQFVGESWGETAANLIPSVVLPLLEVWSNYNSFRDTNIIRPWDLGLDTDLQYNDFTSDTAKALGKIIPVAPANLDHLIFGYTASLGRIAVGGLDMALRSLDLAEPSRRPARQLQQQFVIGNFLRTRSFGASSRSIQDIYDFSTAVTDLEASIRTDQERRDPTRAARRRATMEQEWWWPRRGPIMAQRKRFTALGKRIRAIYEAPQSRMSQSQKREELNQIYESMARGAASALGRPFPDDE
jgi:hypothetical protein